MQLPLVGIQEKWQTCFSFDRHEQIDNNNDNDDRLRDNYIIVTLILIFILPSDQSWSVVFLRWFHRFPCIGFQEASGGLSSDVFQVLGGCHIWCLSTHPFEIFCAATDFYHVLLCSRQIFAALWGMCRCLRGSAVFWPNLLRGPFKGHGAMQFVHVINRCEVPWHSFAETSVKKSVVQAIESDHGTFKVDAWVSHSFSTRLQQRLLECGTCYLDPKGCPRWQETSDDDTELRTEPQTTCTQGCLYDPLTVVPRKAVVEVLKEETNRRRWLLWCLDGRAKVVGLVKVVKLVRLIELFWFSLVQLLSYLLIFLR